MRCARNRRSTRTGSPTLRRLSAVLWRERRRQDDEHPAPRGGLEQVLQSNPALDKQPQLVAGCGVSCARVQATRTRVSGSDASWIIRGTYVAGLDPSGSDAYGP